MISSTPARRPTCGALCCVARASAAAYRARVLLNPVARGPRGQLTRHDALVGLLLGDQGGPASQRPFATDSAGEMKTAERSPGSGFSLLALLT
jgi:hypothetical protein